ncbi:hypothetical protein KKA27_03240 [Patescibacteria group bacterium]|nr:hypothetical protein [Patescibacteria group bacterium]MBU2633232.1 hypothetical protein [Patescibacteria group bacterium]
MTDLINKILEKGVWPFIIFLFVLTVAIFLWGLIEFVVSADNEEKKTIGKRHLIWGIAGMFIMFSVWGIISIIQNFISSL